MSFNPNEHLRNLKGSDYLDVKWRLVWFREDHPDWQIHTEIVKLTEDAAVFKATIYDGGSVEVNTAHGSETMKDFKDFMEKAETKAVGRALAMLGYGTQFAPEFDEGERIVDSPVEKPKKADEKTEQLRKKAIDMLEKSEEKTAATPPKKEPPMLPPEKRRVQPTTKRTEPEVCEGCGNYITVVKTNDGGFMTVDDLIALSMKRSGKKLCAACMKAGK